MKPSLVAGAALAAAGLTVGAARPALAGVAISRFIYSTITGSEFHCSGIAPDYNSTDSSYYNKLMSWIFYQGGATWIGVGTYNDTTGAEIGTPAYEEGGSSGWTSWYFPSEAWGGNDFDASEQMTSSNGTWQFNWTVTPTGQQYSYSTTYSAASGASTRSDTGVDQESSQYSWFPGSSISNFAVHVDGGNGEGWYWVTGSSNQTWAGSPTMQITGSLDNQGPASIQSVSWP